jgi:hypothetical protein
MDPEGYPGTRAAVHQSVLGLIFHFAGSLYGIVALGTHLCR